MQTQSSNQSELPVYATTVINKKTDEHINLMPLFNFLERYSHTTTDASHVIDSVARGWTDGNPEINETNVLEVLYDLSYMLKMMGIDNITRPEYMEVWSCRGSKQTQKVD